MTSFDEDSELVTLSPLLRVNSRQSIEQPNHGNHLNSSLIILWNYRFHLWSSGFGLEEEHKEEPNEETKYPTEKKVNAFFIFLKRHQDVLGS